MRKTKFLLLFFSSLLLVFTCRVSFGQEQDSNQCWKAGIARTVITPEQPMWMSGYAVRTHEADGIIHELWAKALIIVDKNGERALLVTTDLDAFPKYLSDRIRNRIEKIYGLKRSRILLNSSHTHSGPVLQGLYNCYQYDSLEVGKIKNYSEKLEDKIISIVGEAVKSAKPARLYALNGITRFQVNRRNNKEYELTNLTELKGPNDYSVPVIKIVDLSGKPMAVAFGYACHNTTLDGYQWCGDYAGFAQIELERAYPGITAMFFQGAGADQNPLPRRKISLAQQYGRELAAAVERVLDENMKELKPELKIAYSEIPLELSNPPANDVLLKMIQSSTGYVKKWAEDLLTSIQKGENIPSSYPYPVQVWKIGDLPVFSLGGEVVVQYSLELKRLFGQNAFVLSYCNDVMAYIPSDEILKEGGYEGDTSMIAFGLPAPWKSNVEKLIMEEAIRLAKIADVPLEKQ